jgi:hypothetical protein
VTFARALGHKKTSHTMYRAGRGHLASSHVVVSDLMFPIQGWIWHLDGQVAGRSPGQFPCASQHDLFSSHAKQADAVCQVLKTKYSVSPDLVPR